eukprot:9437179-Prorocentrum_lima.AAC.1
MRRTLAVAFLRLASRPRRKRSLQLDATGRQQHSMLVSASIRSSDIGGVFDVSSPVDHRSGQGFVLHRLDQLRRQPH